jgi:hypothetical protein
MVDAISADSATLLWRGWGYKMRAGDQDSQQSRQQNARTRRRSGGGGEIANGASSRAKICLLCGLLGVRSMCVLMCRSWIRQYVGCSTKYQVRVLFCTEPHTALTLKTRLDTEHGR